MVPSIVKPVSSQGRLSSPSFSLTHPRQVFAEYDPNFIGVSLDEASLDISGLSPLVCLSHNHKAYLESHPDATWKTVTTEIQQKIFDGTALTCSIGIAPNRRLAKICSDQNKPNGFFRVEPDQ